MPAVNGTCQRLLLARAVLARGEHPPAQACPRRGKRKRGDQKSSSLPQAFSILGGDRISLQLEGHFFVATTGGMRARISCRSKLVLGGSERSLRFLLPKGVEFVPKAFLLRCRRIFGNGFGRNYSRRLRLYWLHLGSLNRSFCCERLWSWRRRDARLCA